MTEVILSFLQGMVLTVWLTKKDFYKDYLFKLVNNK